MLLFLWVKTIASELQQLTWKRGSTDSCFKNEIKFSRVFFQNFLLVSLSSSSSFILSLFLVLGFLFVFFSFLVTLLFLLYNLSFCPILSKMVLFFFFLLLKQFQISFFFLFPFSLYFFFWTFFYPTNTFPYVFFFLCILFCFSFPLSTSFALPAFCSASSFSSLSVGPSPRLQRFTYLVPIHWCRKWAHRDTTNQVKGGKPETTFWWYLKRIPMKRGEKMQEIKNQVESCLVKLYF